jgi:MerR family copper efflux transcriptional regulator
MHIGEVAARTDLSLRSLRHWDQVGLLRPSGRTEGGFRLYTEADVEKILLIRRMKPLGFTLSEMSDAMRDLEVLLDSPGSGAPAPDAAETAETARTAGTAGARERLGAVLAEAHERRERLTRQLAMADEFIDLLGRRLA